MAEQNNQVVVEEEKKQKPRSFVWDHAVKGLTWGVYIGIGLKCLDTFIGLVQVDVLTAVLFLVAIGVCFIPKVGVGAAVVLALVMSRFTGLNLFITVIAAALIGAILGALPGLAIGGLTGILRRNSPRAAGMVTPESGSIIITAFIIPLIGGIALFLVYWFVFNPWLISVID
jgi:hypothetical protein